MTPDISSRFLLARMWAPNRFFKNRRHLLSEGISLLGAPQHGSVLPLETRSNSSALRSYGAKPMTSRTVSLMNLFFLVDIPR